MANNPKKYASDSTVSAIIAKIKELFVKKTDLETSLSNKADKSHTHPISNVTNLQSTLDGKVPTSRTINSKPLTANVTLSASDVGAAPSTHDHNSVYYTQSQVDSKLSGKSDTTHNHDNKYDAKGAAAAVQENLDTVSEALDDHIDNTDIHFTTAERTKLSGIAAGAQVNTITGVKGNSESSYRTGNVNITKANIGLGNVDNTSDANKPISTAQQLAFDTVNDTIDTHKNNSDIHVTTDNKTNWNAAHTHSTSAHARTDATKVEDSSTNGNIKINGTETNVYSHPTSGVSAGTYKSVTVDAQGHITGGSNPTTLSGYGITDGASKTDVANHNTATDSHADIRGLINGLTNRLNTLANSDDATLDQMSEIVAYIKNNKTLIDGVTTSKINVADIINNLTTNVSNKPLSAAQGVAIKGLIDALQTELDSHKHTVSDITDLTATATELNYMDGVTSNVQTQIDEVKGTYLPLVGGTVTGATIFSHKSTGDDSVYGDSYGSPSVVIGGTPEQAHLELDNNEIQAKGSRTTTGNLFLNSHGGEVHVGGGGLTVGIDANGDGTGLHLNSDAITPETALNGSVGTSTSPFNRVFGRYFELYGAADTQYGRFRVGTTGTTSRAGTVSLELGNDKSTGTAHNASGKITMYGSGTGFTNILPNTNTSGSNSVYLPTGSGTLALVETSTKVATMKSAEYDALTPEQIDANTLYMITDEEEPIVQFITWEEDD